MIDEDSKRRAGTAQKALSSAAAIPSQPIAVQLPPLSSARKRSATAREGVNAISSAANASPSVNWAAHGSPLPPSRAKELAALPAIFVDLGPGQAAPAIFTRQSLSAILGGCGQGLIVRCTDSASQLARNHNISCFLCPNMDHNPWSPSGPGKHGYMQVGLGRDKDLFNDGEYRHVFVGAGKHLIYCGWYHALRVERLTKEEWTTLPQKVQTAYATTTVNKEKSMELKSRHHALAMYNTGKLRAPCVRLQCVGFDTAFYQQLVRANDQYFMLANASGGSSAKRRRVSQADAQEDDSEEDVRRPAAVPSAKRAVPQVVNITPPASASAPQNGEVVVKQAIATDARLAPTPSVKRVGSSSQVPSHPPVGPRRPSTRTASGTLTLRGPGF
ncbi:hypothetical protein FKP32DRAFT_1231163 [Trametes sanguinea]|nr:hypothetical protein FKP32DRAFT_1231163 [Trametes sanguinea]